MKKLTCKQLGGVCDEVITGSTAKEMENNVRQHGMHMVMKGDQAHIAAMQKMMAMKPEELQKFMDAFHQKFSEAEEA